MNTRATRANGGRSLRALTLLGAVTFGGVGSVLLLASGLLTMYGYERYGGGVSNGGAGRAADRALDVLSHDVREARGLVSGQAHQIVLEDSNRQLVRYDYDPSAQSLTRSKDGVQTVLLKGCDTLNFGMYRRSPMAGTDQLYPAAGSTDCRVIEMTWRCAGSLLGRQATGEAVQSARFVIRRQ